MELKGTRRTVPVVPGPPTLETKKIRPLWPDFFESRCRDRASTLSQVQCPASESVPYLRCDVEEI